MDGVEIVRAYPLVPPIRNRGFSSIRFAISAIILPENSLSYPGKNANSKPTLGKLPGTLNASFGRAVGRLIACVDVMTACASIPCAVKTASANVAFILEYILTMKQKKGAERGWN